MAYSAEVIARARRRLAAAKADRESEEHAHLAEAYQKLPQLRQIDQALRQTMTAAAQAVFSGGDAQTEMEKAKQENLSLQRQRQELLRGAFPEGYLDEKPICPVCGGNGYIGSRMCQCLMNLCRQEQRMDLERFGLECVDFDQFRLDCYPDRPDPRLGVNIRAAMEKTLHICRQYAATFSEKSGNLLFSGDTGLGKTFLSACIAAAVTDRGYSVVYESASRLFSKLEKARFNGDDTARRAAEGYETCDLLIVDDLGTEMPGTFVTASLYALMNERILSGKSMIISTNLNTDDLPKRYSPQIASRLRGNFLRVAFLGEDIRVKKNWGL